MLEGGMTVHDVTPFLRESYKDGRLGQEDVV